MYIAVTEESSFLKILKNFSSEKKDIKDLLYIL